MALPLIPTIGRTGIAQRSPTGVRYRYIPPIFPRYGTALHVHDGLLFCAGNFPRAGLVDAINIAAWDGGNWAPLAEGQPPNSTAMTSWAGNLIVGGSGRSVQWDSSAWSAFGSLGIHVEDYAVHAEQLHVVGSIWGAGEVGRYVKVWSGSAWTNMVTNSSNAIYGVHSWEGDLLICGVSNNFGGSGGFSYELAARYDGSTWSNMSSGVTGSARKFVEYGGELYLIGLLISDSLQSVAARWTGSAWQRCGVLAGNFGLCAAVYGGELIVGHGIGAAGNISKWNGSAWSSLGAGLNRSCDALAVYDGKLIAAGKFTTAGGAMARGIAAWDGSTWSPLGKGLHGPIFLPY